MTSEGSSKKVVYHFDVVRKICALVVDDDPEVQRVHTMLLEKHRLEIQAAYSGQDAVDLVKSGKIFHLVLMDMEMPIMNGPQATRILRGIGVNYMIVGVTASSVEAEKTTFMEAGLDLIMNKPLDGEDVIHILNELAKEML